MSQIRKHSIKGITDVLASTDAASKSYFDSINKLSPGPSGLDYNTTIVENNYSSSNFDKWTIRTLSDNISSNTINYLAGAVSDEYYVIGGNSGIQNIQKSTDGTIWSVVGAEAPSLTTTIGDIVYSGEYYFVSPLYAVSTDTVVWSLRTSGGLLDAIQAAGYGGGVYLSIGRGSDGALTTVGKISASTDTIHWTYRTSIYSTNNYYGRSYAYHSGTNTHVVGGGGLNGSGGEIHISTDSVVWTVALTVGVTNFNTTYYDSENQLIFSAGVNSSLYVSTDTLSWSARTVNGAIGLGKDIQSIAWDSRKKLYYLSSTGRVFASSTDSTVWTEESSPLSVDNTSAYILSSDRSNSTIVFSNHNEIATSLSLLDSNPGRFLSVDYDDIFVEQETNLEELGFVNNDTFDSYPDAEAGVYGNGYFLQYFYWSTDSNLSKLAASTDGNYWVVRTFNGIGVANLYVAAYGNGYYLMAGRDTDTNTLCASTDTIVWEKRTATITGDLEYQGASYGNGIYILNQSGPKIHASTDTIVWAARTTTITFGGGTTRSGYADGYHVVFGSQGTFIVSTDSVIWTKRTCGFTDTVGSYSYGNGIHLIEASSSLFASTDTIVWVARTTSTNVSELSAYDSVSKKYTYFRNASNTDRIYQSTDSIHWENDGTIFDGSSSREIASLNFNNDDNYFLAVVEPGNDSPKVYKKQSPQKVWQSASDSESSIRGFKEFYYTGSEETFVLPTGSNNYYIEVIGGGGGGASADTDSTPISGGSGSSSQYNSFKIERSEIGDTKQFNIFVGAGGLGGDARGCSSSTDNLNWDTVIGSFPSSTNWEDIAYGNGTYVICGSSGRLITSTDTNTWIVRTSGTTSGSIGIVYGNGIYALINSQTSARISTDGIVWIARTSRLVVPQDIQYINNAFFACGSSASMVVSSDGVIWQRRTTGVSTSFPLYRVGYSENDSKYFACGSGRTVIDSTDSMTWVARTSGQDYTGSDVDVNYLNGIYILAASRQILVSTDFISWQSRTFDTSASTSSSSLVRRGIAYFNGNYSIAGRGANSNPEYLVSTDTIVWESRGRRKGYSTENKIIHNGEINNVKVINDKIFILANPSAQGGTSDDSYVQWTDTDGVTLRAITSPNGNSAGSTGSSPATVTGSKNAFFSSVIRNGDGGSQSSDYGDYLQSNQTSSYEIVASSAGLWGSSDTGHKNTIYYYGNEYIQKSEPSIVAPGTYWNESPVASFISSKALTHGKYSYVSEGGNEWTSRTSGVVNNINSVSSSLGEYLAVGTDVLQSTDNVHWTLRSSQGSYNSSRHSDSANVFNNRIVDGDVSIWTLRTIGYTNFDVSEVLYSPSAINNYVVTSGGAILSSTNTIEWTIEFSGGNAVTGSGYGNNLYLVGDIQGNVRTSTDGINWPFSTSGLPPTSSSRLNNFDYSASGIYSACGNNGIVISSTDSTVWTLRTTGISADLSSIVSFSDNYVSVGDTGIIIKSTDAIHWETVTSGVTEQLNSVVNRDGLYVVGGNTGTLLTSPDGSTWTVRTTTGNAFNDTESLAYNDTFYIAGQENPQVAVSTDAIHWESRATTFYVGQFYTVAYFANLFFAGAANGTLLVSPDYSYGVVPEQYSAAGTVGKIDTSTDSVMWELRTSGIAKDINEIEVAAQYESVIQAGTYWTARTADLEQFLVNVGSYTFANNLHVYTTTGGDVRISTDTIVWERRTSGTTSIPQDMIYQDGIFVFAGTSGTIFASTDTIHWESRISSLTDTINSIVYGNEFVAVGNNGTCTASTDSVTWILRTTASVSTIFDLIYENGIYVSAGEGFGTICMVSTDSVTWEGQNTGNNNNKLSIEYLNNQYYVIAGGNGAIHVSTDTVTWEIRTTGVSNFTTYVSQYINDVYFLFGGNFSSTGIYLTSTDNVVWQDFKTESLPGLVFQSEIVDNIVVTSGARGLAVSQTYDRLGYFPQEPFVAVGDDGKLLCSTDEVHWTSKTKIESQSAYDLKSTNYADQTYTIGGGYDIAPLGTVWTLRTVETPNYSFNSLAYGNSTFVGTNTNELDDIETSTDGTTWVSRLPGFTSNPQNVYSDGTNFLAVGSNPSNTSGMITYSTDSITWILRTSGVNASNFQSVYGNNEWVVSAGSGNILHSTDTISWSTRVNPISGDIRQIGYGDGYYLAADSNGIVAASTDSVMWELRTTGASGFSGVATYKNGYYFISNFGTGALIVSTNTVEWSKRTLRPSFEGSSNYTRSVAYVSGRYFAADDSGSVAVSTDTIAWELSVRVNFAAGFLADNGVDNLVHVSTSGFVQSSGDLFNDSVLATSTDNIIWSSRTTTIDSDYINGIASDGTTTVAVGGGYLEGTLWTVRTSGFTTVVREISYANQTTFITGNSGAMSLSTDAIHWVARTTGSSSTIYDVIYSSVDDLYLSGEEDDVIISTDTIVWEQTDLGTSPNLVTSVNYVNNIYIVGGTGGMMRTSTDAIVWETRDTGGTNQLGRVIYQDSQYLLSANNDTIKSSTDTVVWIDRDTGTTTGDFFSLVFGGGLYVADGGSDGTLIVSTDSVVWTQRTIGFNSFVNDVTYRDVYVITGNDEFIAVSTDTIVWTARTTNIVGNLAANTYDNNLFIAAGANGTIATSPVFDGKGSISQSTDGIHWTARTSGLDTRIDLNTVRYEDGIYLAGGADGIIITSTDGTSWKVKSSPTSNNINDFVGGNNRLYENGIITSGTKDYVAVGDIGTVLSGNGENISRTVEYFWDTNSASTDGIIWTLRTSAGSNYTQNNRTVFNDGLFYSLIDSGSGLSVSTDTVAWTLRTIGIPDVSFNTSQTIWKYIEYDETDGSYYLGGSQSNYGRVAYSTDAIVWVDRQPGVGTSNLTNIRSFNGLAIVSSVGNGHLEVSDNNGITWSRRTTGLGLVTYWDFAYFKGLYVSTTSSNGCVVSTDTITWTLRTSGINGNALSLHNTGDYLITNALISGRKYVFTSSDTISWEGYDTNLGDNINAFANSEDTLVLSGNSGQHATSQAYAYTVVSGGSGIEPSLNGGVGSGGLGGQVYGNRFKAWSIRTTNISAADHQGGRLVAYHAGRYILTGMEGEGAIQTSTDSIVWEIPEFDFIGVSGLPADNSSATSGAVANNDEYAIVQFYNNMWASTDTITWQLRTVSNISSGNYSGRRWGSWDGSTYFLYANGQNGLKVSTDTVVWTQRTLGFATGIAYNLIKGGELYVAAGGNSSNGELFVSTDTISWEERAVPNPLDTNDITALTYSDRDGLYLIGETGDVAVSTDTIVWTLRTTGANTTNSYDIVYANGLYFGGTGSNAQLIYSTDTIAWELFIPNEFEGKFSDDVGYVNGRYYNVTNNFIGFTSNIDYPTLAGNGFDGTRGGGGGGGSYDPDGIKWGLGGSGGNGYVKITWW